jgi:hypothetical protein
MKKNVSTADRIVRAITGLVVVFFVLNGTITGIVGTVLAVVAIVLIGTGAISFCPIYAALGISTRGKVEKNQSTRPV